MNTKSFKANEQFQTNSDKIAVTFDEGAGSVVMEYSVDGTVWTPWSENIVDANVIVNNIPIGLYLRFSVAGKYTN